MAETHTKKFFFVVSIFLVVFLFLGFFSAHTVSATSHDNQPTYTPLTPTPLIPGEIEIGPSSDKDKGLVGFVNRTIRFSVALAAIFAVVVIVIGGIQYMTTGSVTGKGSGKEKVRNAILGLLLALGAFIILNTINPRLVSIIDLKPVQITITEQPSDTGPPVIDRMSCVLYEKNGENLADCYNTRSECNSRKQAVKNDSNLNLTFGCFLTPDLKPIPGSDFDLWCFNWEVQNSGVISSCLKSELECTNESAGRENRPASWVVKECTEVSGTFRDNRNPVLREILADEDRVRDILTRAGIGINNPACQYVGQTSCTNVGLLGQKAIDGLLVIKSKCNCDVTVTGGTEWWAHVTHGKDKPIVDIRTGIGIKGFYSSLDEYIYLASGQAIPDPPKVPNRNEVFIVKLGIPPSPVLQDVRFIYEYSPDHWHVIFP